MLFRETFLKYNFYKVSIFYGNKKTYTDERIYRDEFVFLIRFYSIFSVWK